ncbi:sulfate adenylyltransferase subunit CysN [Nocardia farcinica]|uniref:Multifunctional fusion protein n=1 Tax=Nocardia farcinica (strain IFM 10152) TaxID=247156 RepID=Q5YUA2_NOCFA|nr:sulfate adenylyltransferase subunit CysN [Nocardia farcinica]BAD58239.1 putative ATP sulfurylase large subunit [Nocardia farcinica IFM 10152]
MAHTTDDLVRTDIEEYLRRHERKSLLRLLTCGSVDDGKSTLIGRLLYDSKLVFADHLAQLERDSRTVGTQNGELDFALLVDGLAAEREQGITIDVAYRFFSTEKRKFIVADTPGHEQYTRNMVTGASTADAAVILVDARKGLLTQTRRHSFLVSLLGIRHIVLAVNKLDLVGYSQERFDKIAADYREFAAGVGLTEVTCIPISALRGDNITQHSAETAWYTGPTLVEHLESIPVDETDRGALRLPVQWVNRPDLDFRGYSGQIVGGTVRPGDRVRVLPSGRESTVDRVVTADGDLDSAVTGQSVTVVLADDIDVSRGDVLAAAARPPQVADQFEANLVWMSEQPMLPGRAYELKLATAGAVAQVARPKYTINVNTLEHTAARSLSLNEIGVCDLHLDRQITFDPYTANRDMGGFILIDRLTRDTVAAGMLKFALRRAGNIHWQHVDIDKHVRARAKGQQPAVVWFTGLSGAGKSTVANLVEKRLHEQGYHTYLLDGDNVRHGLNADLGFTDADRVENIRRVVEVARLLADAGLIVLTSFIAPFRAERQLARERIGAEYFLEVHVDAPLEVVESRDSKGLYAKARRGELVNFTGIDSPYEVPESPDLRLDSSGAQPPEALAEQVIERLRAVGKLEPETQAEM